MSPPVATAITAIIILYMLFAEAKTQLHGVSKAIWVPFAWMFLAGSRYVSQWLYPNAASRSPDAIMEGSPLDRMVFLLLVILGILVLLRRDIKWKVLLSQNRWACAYLLFGMASILWSQYPSIAAKRWIKALGTPTMALILLTEERPWEAVGALLRRLAYLLLPLSVLFIKFYPHLGRAYHMGRPMFTGVASQKNGLGQLCLITGIYLAWDLLLYRRVQSDVARHRPFLPYALTVVMIVWLMHMGDSATSLVALVLCVIIVLVSRVRWVVSVPRRILAIGLTAVFVGVTLEMTLGVSARLLEIIGRDPTLTTRVPMWQALLDMAPNPIVGAGYESFWLGGRLSVLLDAYGVRQAHNGYLETYLNLGLVGLSLMVGTIISGLFRVRRQLQVDYGFGILRLCLIIAVVVYNWTEATLYGVNNMWILLLLGCLDTSPIPETVRCGDRSVPGNNSTCLHVSVR